MKKILYIHILVWLFFFSSCSDFLEPKSNTDYVPTDVESLEDVILGVATPGYGSGHAGYYGFLYLLDDDITTRPYLDIKDVDVYGGTDIARGASILYSWTKDYESAYNNISVIPRNISIYKNLYKYIAGANVALDYVDKLEGSSIAKNSVKAQAHALRAFHYFHLTNVYGTPYNSHPNGLAVPLKLVSGLEDRYMTRNTVKECYEQIEKDFLLAEENYLAMGEEHKWRKNYRVSLPMVRLMLSRMYLYMENWSEAARYAKLVMEDSNFALHDLNGKDIPNNLAGTREIPYINFISYDPGMTETIWLFGNASDGRSTEYLYTAKNATSGSVNNAGLFNASEELLASYGEKLSNPEDDLRLSHYIVNERYNNTKESLKRAYGKINVGLYSKGRWPNSTVDVKAGEESIKSAYAYGYALRLSEAYLNYAEAMAMMTKNGVAEGSISETINALNDLREKRIKQDVYVPLTSGDFGNVDELINFVRNERRRELCYEGHRWFDLRRYGMPEIKHIWRDNNTPEGKEIILPAKGEFYAVPLQESVLELNSALDPNTWR